MTNTGRYIRAVLWDMDGTLMDSQPLWDESFRNCCRERGGTVTPEQVAGIAGASIARTCELIAETGATASPQDPATAEVFAEISARVEAAVRADPPILPGARSITATLNEIGLAQVIVTQSPRPIVEAVAHALGDVSPQECVVVEDSATGAASARSNDLRVIQVGGETKLFPGDPGLVVVKDLASITPHLLLWDDSIGSVG